MRDRTIVLTEVQQRQVLDEIRSVPAAPVGEHLTDDEAIGYAEGSLAAEALRRVDAHLASCPGCTESVERLLEAAAYWSGPDGQQRLVALGRRLLVPWW